MKDLIAYFSASGITRVYAEELAELLDGDIFEIEPTVLYTKEDLNWMNPRSRSSVEMKDKTSRPEIKGELPNIENYNKIYIGFPVWWYTCPHIINTFLENYDFSNKEVYVFCTSGSTKEDTVKKSMEKDYPFIKKYKRITNNNDLKELIVEE